ncbi:MAG: alpha/beta hydrolase [Zetaproteobacteria bacterium]|nr:alpha/beta hydrolase [Zetaproteobacteria bacterium]
MQKRFLLLCTSVGWFYGQTYLWAKGVPMAPLSPQHGLHASTGGGSSTPTWLRIAKVAGALGVLGGVAYGVQVLVNTLMVPASTFPVSKLTLGQKHALQRTAALEADGIQQQVFAGPYGPLHTLRICPAQADKMIVMLGGNAMSAADTLLGDGAELMQATQACVIAFDYPSLKGSKLVDSTAALVRDQVARFGARHTFLVGHSLGGAVAIEVAAQLKAEGRTLRVVTDRTFTRMDTEVHELMGLPMLMVKPLLYLLGWQLNPLQSIQQLAAADQLHFYIEGDEIIQGQANFSFAKQALPELPIFAIDPLPAYYPRGSRHNLGLRELTSAQEPMISWIGEQILRWAGE